MLNCRDHYFETHQLEEAAQKPQQIQERLDAVLEEFEARESAGVSEDRTMFLYLKGRLLNVTGEFSGEAEECLSKSVKLNPNLVDAWNELGESYMRKLDWTTARTCFEVRDSFIGEDEV